MGPRRRGGTPGTWSRRVRTQTGLAARKREALPVAGHVSPRAFRPGPGTGGVVRERALQRAVAGTCAARGIFARCLPPRATRGSAPDGWSWPPQAGHRLTATGGLSEIVRMWARAGCVGLELGSRLRHAVRTSLVREIPRRPPRGFFFFFDEKLPRGLFRRLVKRLRLCVGAVWGGWDCFFFRDRKEAESVAEFPRFCVNESILTAPTGKGLSV